MRLPDSGPDHRVRTTRIGGTPLPAPCLCGKHPIPDSRGRAAARCVPGGLPAAVRAAGKGRRTKGPPASRWGAAPGADPGVLPPTPQRVAAASHFQTPAANQVARPDPSSCSPTCCARVPFPRVVCHRVDTAVPWNSPEHAWQGPGGHDTGEGASRARPRVRPGPLSRFPVLSRHLGVGTGRRPGGPAVSVEQVSSLWWQLSGFSFCFVCFLPRSKAGKVKHRTRLL